MAITKMQCFPRIFGKVCNRIERRTEIVTVITVLQMKIVLWIKTKIQCEGSSRTVRLIWIAHFSVHVLLLHHYGSDLAHLSDFDSLVIGLPKSEIWVENEKKRRTSSTCMKSAHFLVVSVRKYMVKKYLIYDRFDFLERFFFEFFW